VTKPRYASTGLLLLLTAASCGDGTKPTPQDGAAAPDGRTPDAPDVSDARGPDAQDGAAEVRIAPPGLTRQLVSGHASLVGSGPNTCTNQPGLTDDRWCGFTVAAATAGRYELWVIDATRAAGGVDLKCDGTDAHCLRLSTNAYYDRFVGPGDDGFEGDTLVYKADADPTATQGFVGPVYAWRPGWPAGRKLTSPTGVVCSGHKTQPVALCLQNRVQNAAGDVSYDLVAGPLPAADDAPLPEIETLLATAGTDRVGADQFQVGLSPDGAYVAWSARPTPDGQETLKTQKIADATTRQTVATNVSSWEISRDGTRWLWLRAFNHDDLVPSGTLEIATFPDGADVSTLAPSVSNYQGVGDNGVLYRDNVVHTLGDLRLMPDRAAPATTTLVDQMVAAVLATSDDATTIVYSKTLTAVGNDVFAWTAALATPCTVWAAPSASSTAYLMAGNRVVVWAQEDVMSQVVSVAATPIASCATATFGPNLLRWLPFGDDRVVFLDEAAGGATTGILRATQVGDTSATGPGTPLAAAVDPVYAPVYAQAASATPAVLYTVGTQATEAGLYIYAGTLLGEPSPPSDAGIGDAGALEAGPADGATD
jgi:hypothetical protein